MSDYFTLVASPIWLVCTTTIVFIITHNFLKDMKQPLKESGTYKFLNISVIICIAISALYALSVIIAVCTGIWFPDRTEQLMLRLDRALFPNAYGARSSRAEARG